MLYKADIPPPKYIYIVQGYLGALLDIWYFSIYCEKDATNALVRITDY